MNKVLYLLKMNVLGDLTGTINQDQMRITRIKDILKHNTDVEEMKDGDAFLQLDKGDSKFIQLHLENKCTKYHMYFGDFNIEMFQKLWTRVNYREYDKQQVIFDKQDPWRWFYFIVKGTIHILEQSSTGEDKISKIHNSNQVFGLTKHDANWNEVPSRNKTAISEGKSIVLVFDAIDYESIRRQRVLSTSEQKVEFLTQHVPGMRVAKREAIEEFESLFSKEICTKGFRILHQDKYNEYLYFIITGQCRILYNYNANKNLKQKFDSLDESLPSLMQIGKLSKGDCFGQSSSIQRQKWKYSVQVLSDELVVYKISAQQFYDNFGKENGAPIQRMRGKALMDNNWISIVIKKIWAKEIGQIMSEWEFFDKAVNPNANCMVQQESPFLKKKQVGSISEISKQEERRRMKESLLAPFQNSTAKTNLPSQSSGQRSDMESKYKGVFGFGTPNIRPGKRLKHMNQEQLKSHISLQKLWGEVPRIPSKDKDANDFLKTKASDFLKRTRAAEIELKSKAQEDSGSSIPSNQLLRRFI